MMLVNREWSGAVLALAGLVLAGLARGQAPVPGLLNYQGRVTVAGTNFTGAGAFKFALVDPTGTASYWSNDGTSVAGGAPAAAVALPVNKGLYSVALGDATLANMSAVPAGVFTNSDVRLRVWFNDGAHGFELLAPDQRLVTVGYAFMAAAVAPGAVTSNQLATPLVGQLNGLGAQLATLATQVGALSNQLAGAIPPGLTAASTLAPDPTLAAQGLQLFSTLAAPGWTTSAAAGAPSARSRQAGVWTGQQLLVWGGTLGSGFDSGSGGSYRPDLDQWQALSTLNPPAARDQHTAVWSGEQMILWGGLASGVYAASGGRYNPSNQLWSATTTVGAPAGRLGHIAVWTGSRMLIWGGQNNSGLLNDGALYDPVADQWTTLTLSNPPAPVTGATAVWTGTRVLIWGGQNQLGAVNNGAQLLCDTNGLPTAWQATSLVNAPAGRAGHTAVWTGQRMLVWGGVSGGVALADGAAYDPGGDSWSTLSATNAPSGRSAQAAVWSGQELLIFGGETGTGTAGDGAAYNPATDTWRPLSGTGNPLARSGATAVWSGTALILFAGLANGTPLAGLQQLNPQPTWYLYRKP